jgi:hypothetical protein
MDALMIRKPVIAMDVKKHPAGVYIFMFDDDFYSVVKALIIEMLDLLCKCVSDHKKPPAEEALILFNLIEEDNFQSTPSEMRYPLSLVPIVSNYIIENSSDYRKFSRILLNDEGLS